MASEEGTLSLTEELDLVKETGLSSEELAARYNVWAQGAKYDKDLNQDVYNSPSLAAAIVAQYVTNKDVRILDVGAGTGRVATQLRELGFTQIDALDGSEGMLEVARQKNLYQKYICAFFEGRIDAIETSCYDVLVCCGAIGRGHIQGDVLGEMVRCVKTGGIIVMIVGEGPLTTIPRFEPYMKQLEAEEQWVLLERTPVPFYGQETAVKFVLKVTKTK